MALFKISKGKSENLPTNKVDGYCYVTTNDHKFYVDYAKDDGTLDRFALNAVSADIAQKLGTINIGNSNKPIYLAGGTPQQCVDFLPLSAGENKKLTGPLGLTENVNYGTSLPAEGFEGQLFFLEGENSSSDGPSLPTGGTTGQVLVKNSSSDGDASWATNISGNAGTATKLANARTISLTGSVTGSGAFDGSGNLSISTTTNHTHNSLVDSSGPAGTLTWSGDYMLISANRPQTKLHFGNDTLLYRNDGNAYYPILDFGNYTSYTVKKDGTGASGTWGINISGNANTASTSSNSNWLNTNAALQYGASGLNYFNISSSADGAANTNGTPTADWYHIIRMNHANSNGYYFDIASCFHNNNMYFKRVASGTSSGWQHIWVQGNSVTGAVWNDYAECRESDCEDFGYVLMETGNDSLTKTTERLSHFAGVSSDTWGFSQGETARARTPIAVAGRVLVYPYQDRNNYKPGDCVCAAPGGTVDIMTREEVREWPDRIVGTVSCVPDYEEWGGGEGADRDPVKVNGRIWIKVK